MISAAIAAFLLSAAAANASTASAYIFQTPIVSYGPETAFVPGTGLVPVEETSEWSGGYFCTTRRMRYFSPGAIARSPEYVHIDQSRDRVYCRLITTPVFAYTGKIAGHWCCYCASDVATGTRWYPEFWEGWQP